MTDPIRPPTAGLTPEAAKALEQQGIQIDPQDIGSDDLEDNEISEPFETLRSFPTDAFSGGSEVPLSDGDTIDAEIVGEESDGVAGQAPTATPSRQRRTISALHSDTGPAREPRDATTKPPTLDEWTNFFGRVVLRVTCDWYLSYAFRGIDEDSLSDREIERLAMTDDERKMISVPLAELSNKSKFMRKHGRAIVASGDSFNALIVMGAWMSRVNRIANKYRPKVTKGRMNGGNPNGSSGQGTSQATGNQYTEGTGNGRIPNGYPIYRPGSG
jgi:hypothetical protein